MGDIKIFKKFLNDENLDKKFIRFLKKEAEFKKKTQDTIEFKLNDNGGQEFYNLLDEKDLNEREKRWNELTIQAKYLHNAKEMAHPFFVGFGNPNADTLIINKEKAFDIIADKHQYLLNESINNYRKWTKTINKEKAFIEPDGVHQNLRSSHTWKTCNTLVGCLKPLKQEDNNNEGKWWQNLVENSFITEVRHRPSKYSPNGAKIDIERKEFLTTGSFNDFLRSFKRVIIGAHAYINEKNITVEDLFGSNYKNYGKIEKHKERGCQRKCVND